MKTLVDTGEMEVTNLCMEDRSEPCTLEDVRSMVLRTVDPNMTCETLGNTDRMRIKLGRHRARLEVNLGACEAYFSIFRADIGSSVSRQCVMSDAETICREIGNLIDFARAMY